MGYIAYIPMSKRQIPYLTYVDNFTVVLGFTLCKPFLCTPTKSLISRRTPLFSCSVRLIKSSMKVFRFRHKLACFYFSVNSNG